MTTALRGGRTAVATSGVGTRAQDRPQPAAAPVLTVVTAYPLFGEPLTAGLLVALTLIVGGVLCFNAPRRALRRLRPMLGVPVTHVR